MGQFLAWCAARGLALTAVAPLHVAAYIRTHPGSAPTVKQHLAALRMLGDWLVVSQVIPVNPATTAQRLTYLAATHTRQLNAAALAAYLTEFHDAGRAASSAAMAVAAARFLVKFASPPH